MGIYLSTPCTDVFSEEGEGNGVRFAVGEMQGWRKNMEDAHIAIADLKSHVQNDAVDNSVSIFGVFDGHGGKEVAKFVKLKYPEILVNLNSFRAGDIELALRESFHKVDELLEDEQYHELLKELRALPNPSDASKQEVSRSNKNSPTNDAFLKAMLGELGADEDDEDSPQNAVEMIRSLISAAQNKSERKLDSFDNSDASDKEIDDLMDVEDGARELADDKDYAAVSTKNAFAGAVNGSSADVKAEEKSADSQVLQRDPSKREFDEHDDKSRNSDAKATMSTALTVVAESPDASSHGLVSATKSIARKPSQTLKLDLEDDETPMVVSVASTPVGSLDATKYNNESAVYGPPAAISGNSMVCKLKDHRIPAGCTAIVAFKVGNQLYVANAGDSRGVLCRQGGVAYALSDDHKPQSDTEMKRITSAGGFVNMVGRINGNLNLSRSLGDLKYKQLFKLSRAEQIITAEPDISVTTIEPTDRFFILACDGIWDCLTNQQAVDFVSAKLDEGMDVHQIVHEVCKHCVADDPRASTGIGSDNMTCMIVLLNQQV